MNEDIKEGKQETQLHHIGAKIKLAPLLSKWKIELTLISTRNILRISFSFISVTLKKLFSGLLEKQEKLRYVL